MPEAPAPQQGAWWRDPGASALIARGASISKKTDAPEYSVGLGAQVFSSGQHEIDFAISRGLARVEAGAQGEHKLARGYLPVPCHSLHWVADKGFAEAISRYLEAERTAIDEDIEILTSYGPFRRDQQEEQQ